MIEPQQPAEGRIAKMLQSGDRVRLWYGRRFLDHDSLSHDWVVMDSQGNKGLGCSLYVGSDLDKALDALEGEGNNLNSDEIIWPILAGYRIGYCPHCGKKLPCNVTRAKGE